MRSRRGDPRAAGLPLSHTQQTTLRTEAGEARADSLKAICYRWLWERRPEPPRSEGEEGQNAGNVSLTLGLSARPWLKVALQEEAQGNSPVEEVAAPLPHGAQSFL